MKLEAIKMKWEGYTFDVFLIKRFDSNIMLVMTNKRRLLLVDYDGRYIKSIENID